MAAIKKNNLAVADILLLQQQLRTKKTSAELGYFLVNESQKIVPYQIAVLYQHHLGKKRLDAISGLPMPVKEAPFYIWVNALCKEICQKDLSEPSNISKDMFSAYLAEQWSDFLPSEILWLPLLTSDHELLGGLLLSRNEPWKNDEKGILNYWMGAISHSVELMVHKKKSIFSGLKQIKNRLWLALFAILMLVLFIPVSISVLAQAEVVPKTPLVVRAPLEGVISKIFAEPNKTVSKGQLLLSLDDTALKSRLDVAVQEFEIAKAEYRRAEQSSVIDRKASADLPMLSARMGQHQAEVNYVNTLLNRINIHADSSGVAIIYDAYELEGKPVKLGERLLTIAKLNEAELEMWLAVGDSIELEQQSIIELFLNVTPESPHKAVLQYVNFQAEMSPEGLFAFRARADFLADNKIPRIGLRGVAKIYGKKVPLYYYLFRRPYAVLRQWMGI